MRKRFLPIVVAAALGLAPSGARALGYYSVSSECVGSFAMCFDFTVAQDAVDLSLWTMTVAYLPQSAGGTLTAVGIYGPALTNFSAGTQGFGGSGDWTVYAGSASQCSDLFGNTVVCAAANPPPVHNGLAPGEAFTFTFHTSTDVGTGLFTGDYFINGHVQQFVNTNCSVRFATGQPDNLASYSDGGVCPGTSTVPEPVSMLLLASGLGGMAIPALRRRRQKEEQA